MTCIAPQHNNLSNNLKTLRVLKGLTQEQLATLSGLTKQGISQIENQIIKNPHLTTIVSLANALDVTVEDLIN